MFVSSAAGRTPLPGNAAYAATKWAFEAFAETLAIEVAEFGIDVTLAELGPSVPAGWMTCSPTASPATRTRPCSHKAASPAT
jgi:short-subunit dehydrogenase